jgi:hypothetical protein
VPTVPCGNAAVLSVPAPGTVYLICIDPPYYNNVQYADRFYEDKMADVFRRAKQLFHPAGHMIVMFNQESARPKRDLGLALSWYGPYPHRVRAPQFGAIHTEAESSLNIRGLRVESGGNNLDPLTRREVTLSSCVVLAAHVLCPLAPGLGYTPACNDQSQESHVG